ncbi:transmembrane protease serine 9-like [Neocloeon triangulifer]|uniref:transmembrane protease serine 9-like n=1 Tax=Neocloeon triangulifer TaxID=2078957 RepID=UPI00286F5994|nr:transmembrane protease serine 9-like [Neocloeon triangulifer]
MIICAVSVLDTAAQTTTKATTTKKPTTTKTTTTTTPKPPNCAGVSFQRHPHFMITRVFADRQTMGHLTLVLVSVQLCSMLVIAEGTGPKPLRIVKATENIPKSVSTTQWQTILAGLTPKLNPSRVSVKQPTVDLARPNSFEKQIVGGSIATLGQFPWHGYLVATDASGNSFICGSSLILVNYALTAAHCLKNNHYVMFGTISVSSPSAGFVNVSVTTATAHESYNPTTITNDIAVLALASPVTLSDTIKLIALPPASDATTTFVNTAVTISGFGVMNEATGATSDVLKYANLNVVDLSICAGNYSNINASQICALSPINDTDCQGDSGGPLVYLNTAANVYVQIGIVSFGGTTCAGTPSVYVRVTDYLAWIESKIGTTLPTTVTVPTTISSTGASSSSTGASSSSTGTGSTSTGSTVSTTSVKTTTVKTTTTKATTTKKPTTTRTTTTKPPNCASGSYVATSMAKCCGSPFKDLAVPIKNEKVCGTPVNTAALKALTTLTLNKYQIVKGSLNNTINLTDPTFLKAFGKDASFLNCYLISKGLYDNTTKTLNETGLATFLAANQDQAGVWPALIGTAVTECITVTDAIGNVQFINGKLTVDGNALIFAQCILFQMFDDCPSKIVTGSCKSTYTLFETCKPYLAQQFNIPLSSQISSKQKIETGPKPFVKKAENRAPIQARASRRSPKRN